MRVIEESAYRSPATHFAKYARPDLPEQVRPAVDQGAMNKHAVVKTHDMANCGPFLDLYMQLFRFYVLEINDGHFLHFGSRIADAYVVTIFFAIEIVKGIYNTITDAAERHAGFEISGFLPQTAHEGVDYFSLENAEHIARHRIRVAMNIVAEAQRRMMLDMPNAAFIGRVLRDVDGAEVHGIALGHPQTWIAGTPQKRIVSYGREQLIAQQAAEGGQRASPNE
jgi:hypothetical protein